MDSIVASYDNLKITLVIHVIMITDNSPGMSDCEHSASSSGNHCQDILLLYIYYYYFFFL